MNGSFTMQLILNTSAGEAVSPDDYNNIDTTAFQDTYAPPAAKQICFTDPWGNPYVYNEWASIPTPVKDALANSVQISSDLVGGGTGGGETHILHPHDPSKFDIYCFGANGVNEGGDGDDVTSWAQSSKR
jgi:hypothetical protein